MIAESANLSQFGAAFSQALWSGLWIGVLVAVAVGVVVRLHRGLNAASRHAAWYGALLVIAALPVVSLAVSLSRLHVVTVSSPPVLVAMSTSSGGVHLHAAPPRHAVQSTTPTTSAPSALETLTSPASLGRAGFVLVAIVATTAIARLVGLFVGLFGLARVKRASRLVDPSLSPTLARTMARDRGARRVAVRISDSLDAPAAAGFRTPAILLPAELVSSVDSESLDQIAMHEYAHLRRYDDWTNLAQRFIERLYWFHPAIKVVSDRIDLEREIACDDWAVAGADGVSGYADCLLHLARDGRVPAFAATAPGAFATRSQIVARIEHLLERKRDRVPTLRLSKLFALAPVVAGALAIVVGRAPAIAWHVDAPAPSVAFAHVIGADGTHAAMHLAPGAIALGAPMQEHQSTTPRVIAHVPALATHCPTRAHGTARPSTKPEQIAVVVDRAALDRATRQAVRDAISARQAELQAVADHVAAALSTQAAQRAAVAETIHDHALMMKVHAAIHRATIMQRHAIEQIKVQTTSPMVAANQETDNLSFGPNDRNLLAHCTGCDLSNKDLRNADLHGLNLTGDDLSGADLRGANLRQTVMTGVDLSGAKLDGADLRGAVLTGSDIDGATFGGARTDGIKLVGMQLTNAILAVSSVRSIISACAGCDLSNLDLHGRDLHGITLDGADLHGTDLHGANLENAKFNGVDLSGVNFDGADLRGAEFNGCDLQGVDLSHAQTSGIKVQGSNMDGTSWSANAQPIDQQSLDAQADGGL